MRQSSILCQASRRDAGRYWVMSRPQKTKTLLMLVNGGGYGGHAGVGVAGHGIPRFFPSLYWEQLAFKGVTAVGGWLWARPPAEQLMVAGLSGAFRSSGFSRQSQACCPTPPSWEVISGQCPSQGELCSHWGGIMAVEAGLARCRRRFDACSPCVSLFAGPGQKLRACPLSVPGEPFLAELPSSGWRCFRMAELF